MKIKSVILGGKGFSEMFKIKETTSVPSFKIEFKAVLTTIPSRKKAYLKTNMYHLKKRMKKKQQPDMPGLQN
jgi:hypothetical protein